MTNTSGALPGIVGVAFTGGGCRVQRRQCGALLVTAIKRGRKGDPVAHRTRVRLPPAARRGAVAAGRSGAAGLSALGAAAG